MSNTMAGIPVYSTGSGFAYIYDPSAMQLFRYRPAEPVSELCLLPGVQNSWQVFQGRATVSVVRGCNLGCSYCDFHNSPNLTKMDVTVAHDVADWLYDHFSNRVSRVKVSFTSQGEPTLNMLAVQAIQNRLAERVSPDHQLSFSYNFATNGMALKPDTLLAILQDQSLSLFFSIDGPPGTHNLIRGGLQGQDTYTPIARCIQMYRSLCKEHNKRLISSTVLTTLDIRFDRIFQHLEEMGFDSMVFRPVRGTKPFGVSLQTKDLFIEGYSYLLKHVTKKALAGEVAPLRLICNSYDFFGRLLKALLIGEARRQGCPGSPPIHVNAGDYALVLDVNGDVYFPCRDFIGFDKYLIGNIYRQVDLDRLNSIMQQLDVSQRPQCRECWASTMCGGGCYNAPFMSSGQMITPDPSLCELTLYLCKQALELAVAISEQQPHLLDDLIAHALSETPWRATL